MSQSSPTRSTALLPCSGGRHRAEARAALTNNTEPGAAMDSEARSSQAAATAGARILPLSITLLAAAVGIPRFLPQASPRTVVRLGLLAMLAGIVVPVGGHRPQRGRPDRDGPAARGPGHRGDRLAAGRGHRVRGARQAQPRGGWPAEHRHEPGCRHRDGPGGFAAHHRPDDVVPAEHRGESGGPGTGQIAGERSARRWGPLPLRCRPAGGAHPGRSGPGGGPGRARRQPAGAGGWVALGTVGARATRSRRAVRRPAGARPARAVEPGGSLEVSLPATD